MKKLAVTSLVWAFLVCACNNAGQSNFDVVETRVTIPETEPIITEPTPTQRSFQKYSSQDAINAFIAAGLELQNPVPLVADEHSPLPPTYVEAQRFQLPALDGRTGRIFSFESKSDMEPVRTYYEQFSGDQASILIVKDNLLLQINADAPTEIANAYRDVFEAFK